MNLAIRKLAMLEKEFIQKEEEAKLGGFTSSPIDHEFKNRITRVMDKVRLL